MSNGWKEFARLGGSGARYPHVLVDSHGWCLRLGPNHKIDEKYYSGLPALIHGLAEHGIRRRLMRLGSVLDLKEFLVEMRDALRAALSVCPGTLSWNALDEPIRLVGVPGAHSGGSESRPMDLASQEGIRDGFCGRGKRSAG